MYVTVVVETNECWVNINHFILKPIEHEVLARIAICLQAEAISMKEAYDMSAFDIVHYFDKCSMVHKCFCHEHYFNTIGRNVTAT